MADGKQTSAHGSRYGIQFLRRYASIHACLPAMLILFGSLSLPAPAQSQSPAFVKENAANLPERNIYRPANLSGRRTPAPVIVWGNGGCMRFDSVWTSLYERWASEGYVVITVNTPGAMEAQARAMGLPVPGQSGVPSAAAPPAPTVGVRPVSGQMTADDQGKAIDWAVKENATKGSPYAGKLDTKRVVAAGVSCGGITSLTLASRDKRPKSVFVLSGASGTPGTPRAAAEAIMSKVTVPTMWIVGGKEDIARSPANQDYSLLPASVPGVLVERSSGDHSFVSMDKAILPLITEMGLTWFRATLYNDKEAIKKLTTRICTRCDAGTWSIKSKNFGASR